MAFLLIPLKVASTSGSVLVAGLDERPVAGELRVKGVKQHDITTWTTRKFGSNRINYLVEEVRLEPATDHRLEFISGGVVLAAGSIKALPDRLPVAGEKPFTVLLGSCFCQPQDEEGRAGWTFRQIPEGASPDLKILTGDQVYLDSPWFRFMFVEYDTGQLEKLFFNTYRKAWTQTGDSGGFQDLLKSGANFFTADDHEFWNNAPNRAAYVRNSDTAAGRTALFNTARNFYEIFQTTESLHTFAIQNLSFCILDTRINRTTNRTNFVTPANLDAVKRWIAGLTGPGVLAVGQPLFVEKAETLESVSAQAGAGDWNLSDFKQYEELVRSLSASKHDVVVVTGDVHYGRMAHCRLPGGSRIVELIASPMALVSGLVGGRWKPAPDTFPAFGISGVGRASVKTIGKQEFNEAKYRVAANHFMTIEFTRAGTSVDVRPKVWLIPRHNASRLGFVEFPKLTLT